MGLTDLDPPENLQPTGPAFLGTFQLSAAHLCPQIPLGFSSAVCGIIKMVGNRHSRQSRTMSRRTQLAHAAPSVSGIPGMGVTIGKMLHFDLQTGYFL
jgi:hypothetical protein